VQHALFLLLALAPAALTIAAVETSATATAPSHPLHLALYLGAGLFWALSVWRLPRLLPHWMHLPLLVVIGTAVRIPAYLHPPAHSDDLYRYVWEGKVQRASFSPYLDAPDSPQLGPLRDEVWTHVNNRHLVTIYPPLSQLAFRLAAQLPLSPINGWKGIVAAGDLAVALLLLAWLARRGADRRAVAVWLLSPLVIIELGCEGHVDGLGVALLVAALFALECGRQILFGLLLGAAAVVKLLPLSLAPLLRRRALAACVFSIALVSLPYARAGAGLVGSLGEFGRRWRANEGAFALLYAAYAPLSRRICTGGRLTFEHRSRWARLVSGRDRDEIYPDELTAGLARTTAFVLWLGCLLLAVYRRASPLQITEVALGGFLLLTPTLHPWYILWVVPLVALGASSALLMLAVLGPLGYVPLSEWQASGHWRDPVWSRALEHGLVWLLLLAKGLTRLGARVPWASP
jgi:hypothetical protein